MGFRMKAVTLITSNAGKAAELSRLIGLPVQAAKVPVPEIQATDVAVVASLKAEAAYAQLKTPVVVDDTGITFSAWGALPGALTSWFLDEVGNSGLLRMLSDFEDRAATVTTVLAYCDGTAVVTFVGQLTGTIASAPRGSNGFGYDAIFVPNGDGRTFAEMTSVEKDAISMRRIAADKMRRHLMPN